MACVLKTLSHFEFIEGNKLYIFLPFFGIHINIMVSRGHAHCRLPRT